MPDPTITVVVLVRDEQERIGLCLDALAPLGAEVIVVDDCSRDNTAAEAEAHGARVMVSRLLDFASQRNLAVEAATGDWILMVDSDEVAPPELLEEIKELVRGPGQIVAARISVLNHLLGRPLWHAEDRPKIRLFKRGAGQFMGAVHEYLDLPPGAHVVKLRHRLSHYPYPRVSDLVRKQNTYTERDHEIPRRGTTYDLVLLPARRFLVSYFLRRGFLDGLPGFVWSAFTGFYAFLLAVKQLEKDRYPSADEDDLDTGVGAARGHRVD